MTQVLESPTEAQVYFRPVIFMPSGREDYVASASMSFEDWLRLDYEGGLSEWVDGEARLYMSVTFEHQAVVDFLNRLLGLFVEIRRLGVVLSAPYAMASVAGGRGREPDLMFVAARHLARLQSDYLHGPPDLVVEVVSDDSVARDNAEKSAEYAAAGVGEYWVIDSRPGHEGAAFFVLQGDAFHRVEPGEDGIYRSTVVDGFWLRVEWLWESPQPAARALGEILGATFA
jgi:Uma2 family endonuclease